MTWQTQTQTESLSQTRQTEMHQLQLISRYVTKFKIIIDLVIDKLVSAFQF